jgi:hypothetical protein
MIFQAQRQLLRVLTALVGRVPSPLDDKPDRPYLDRLAFAPVGQDSPES